MNTSSPRKHVLGLIALQSILFLFFFQLLSEFVESIYAFGLMGTNIPTETILVLLFFYTLLLLIILFGVGASGARRTGARIACRFVPYGHARHFDFVGTGRRRLLDFLAALALTPYPR